MSDKEFLKAMSDMLDEKLDEKLDIKLQPIYIRLDKLDSDVSGLKEEQREIKKEIKTLSNKVEMLSKEHQVLSEKVEMTYQLALDAWGTGKENRNWLQKAF